MKIRVLVVDDSAVFRRILSEALSSDPEIEVVGSAANGKLALDKIVRLRPDVVVLDVEMPVMDGLTTLGELRRRFPQVGAIMFSSLTEKGARVTIEALARGAFDFVPKPAKSGSFEESVIRIKEELIPKIKAYAQRKRPRFRTPSRLPAQPSPAAPRPTLARRAPAISVPSLASMRRREVVAIGVSTGGPNALAEVIPQLPVNFPAPVLIVQHMPAFFTTQLALRLDQSSKLKVVEAQAGMPVVAGRVYIAPGDFHMEVRETGGVKTIYLHKGPPENSCRPAVDVLFRSVANVYDGRSVAVIMTGMGKDGFKGCQVIKEAGGYIIAQDEATSVVWGMPKFVAEAGLADQVLPLQEIPRTLTEIFKVRQHEARSL
ncbi:protein-glutamate methylesterase/protein-glutamine glutaminase [Thermosulfuriphilus sp.]